MSGVHRKYTISLIIYVAVSLHNLNFYLIFYLDEYHSEWSPDIINDVTRVPDQIVLDKRSAPEQNEEFVTVDINQGLKFFSCSLNLRNNSFALL